MSAKSRRKNRRKSFSSNTFQQLEDRRMLATFVVNNLLDAPISNPGEVPGSLRQAIFDANDSPGADTIVFEGFASSGEIPLSAGTLDVTDSVDIVGPGAADLTINAGGSSSIFQFGDAVGASTFGVSGLTLTGGNGQNNSGIGNFGGAVLFFDQFGSGGEDTLNISDSVITGNSAVLGGGLHSVLGTLNVADTTFSGNNATQGSGEVGGGGLSLLQTDTTFERVTVDGNTASNLGGGIANFVDSSNPSLGDANLTVIDSTISNNTARGGGGILNVTLVDSAEAIVNVSGSSIVGNRASAISGGGIRSDAGIVTVSNSLLENNTATNSGFDGGGILGINANIRVENTTLSNNRAADTAGSIFVLSDRSIDPENIGLSNLDIVNSTVTNSSGGTAIVVRANANSTAIATHQNSIFADNSGANFGASGSGTTTVISAGHNISDDGTGNLTATGDQTNTDPLLLPLADNGGATLTHALRLESPAIDAGSNALAVDAAGNALATDQRGAGFDRVLDAAVDVGAFESELFQGDLVVSTNTDVVDNDFSSGELSLREAVLIANARNGVDTITFDSALNGQTITLTDDALTGELQVTESVDIFGPGVSNLTISGGNTTGIFWFGDETEAATFNVSGLTLTGGNGETDAGLGNFGGAVLFFDQFGGDDTLNISDSTIVDSTAVRGGGLHALLGTLNITNSIIARNSATTSTAFLGGGGLSLEQSDTTLVRVTVADNSANSFGGGVINFAANDTIIEVDSNLTIIDSKIENNTAARGAGIQNITRTSLSEANLSVSNTAISGNDAQDFAGGGIRSEGGSVEVLNSLIFDNTTPLDGGGIFAVNADVRVENSTLSGNSAGDDGGAIFTQIELANDPAGLGTGTLDIVNSTIAFNTGSQGAITVVAAANSTNDATYQNSIFSNNSGANLASFGSGTETLASAGHNISDDTTGNLFTAGDQINTDPLLFPLADNGGLTQTHALQIGSPAIDAGNNALAVDADGNALTTDQRGEGFARILDGNPPKVDIGAFENKTFEGDIVVSENSDVVDSFTGVGQLSLREAILIANDRPGADSITFDSALNGETITLTEGELQVTESVDIAGPGANQLTVSGDEASTVFWFGDVLGASTFSVSGLTIADGNGQNDSGLGVVGGAVLFFDSQGNGGEDTLNISDSVIRDSTATIGGGLHSVLGTLNVTDTTFTGNASTTGALFEGGGGLALQQTDATLERVTVSNNTANSFGGGIISFSPEDATASNDSRLTIIDSTISNNTAERAAGISSITRTDSAEAILNVSGTTISDNTATTFAGGGIRSDGGSVTVSSSLISGNSTGTTGGAIFAVNADLLVENSTLSGNTASDGGAIFALADLGESTGINDGQAVTNIASSTIAFNSGTRAVTVSAAANSVSSVTSANSIFSNHTGSTNFGSFGSGAEAIVSAGFNISDDATGNLTTTGDQPSTDPLLEPLASNGGLTQTHELQVGSPAIDAGNSTLATDQRGGLRPFDRSEVANATGSNGSDIGAFELIELRGLVVTTNLDVVSEFDQVTSIREAIAFADSTPGEDTITFDPALSGSTIQLDIETGNALLINDSLIVDASALSSPLTIVGSGNDRVVTFSASAGDLTIDGLTITRGVTTGTTVDGGGVFFESDGTLTVNNSTISDNSSVGDGGGIFVSDGNLTVNNSTISDNSSVEDGGGIFVSDGNLVVNNSTIRDNSSSGDDGGGVSVFGGNLAVHNTSIIGNTADDFGGGIFLFDGDFTLTDSTISGNTATDSFGGGLHLQSSTATISSSTINGNSTPNAAGGGVNAPSTGLTVFNTTISGNTAGGDSLGGAGVLSSTGSLTLINSTIVQNESTVGAGGVFVGRPLTIENSIIAENTLNGVPSDLGQDNVDADLTINHSLIGNVEGVGTILGNVGNLTGTTANPLDPLLGDLADNGGPTLTHALLPGSPAINAGDNALAVDADGNPLTFDQRGDGFDRIFGGTVDIGAFESQAIDPVGTPPIVSSFVRDGGGELARPDLLSTISVSFDVNVSVSVDDLEIRNDTLGGSLVDTSGLIFNYDSLTQTATWDFSSLTLDAAFYSFELTSDIVSVDGNLSLDGDADGNAGGTFIEPIYVAIPGDANLDGQVNVLGDGFPLVSNLGTTSGATWAQGDFNGDGQVNVLGDGFTLVRNLGQSVVPNATASAMSGTAGPSGLASFEQTPFQQQNVVPIDMVVEEEELDEATAPRDAITAATPELAGDQARDDAFVSEFSDADLLWV